MNEIGVDAWYSGFIHECRYSLSDEGVQAIYFRLVSEEEDNLGWFDVSDRKIWFQSLQDLELYLVKSPRFLANSTEDSFSIAFAE